MKLTVIIIFIVTIVSCSKKEIIHYEFDGITVTRIDQGNEVYFYYGLCSKDNTCSDSYVRAEYSGFVSGMGAYINFLPNNKVEIIGTMAYFEQVGTDSLLYLKETSNIEFIPWVEEIRGNYGNTVQVSDVIELEKEINLKNKSQVKVEYSN